MIIKRSVNNYVYMNLIFEFQQLLRPKNILAVGEDKEKKTEVRRNIQYKIEKIKYIEPAQNKYKIKLDTPTNKKLQKKTIIFLMVLQFKTKQHRTSVIYARSHGLL